MLTKLQENYLETVRSIALSRGRKFGRFDEEVAMAVFTAGILALEDSARSIAQYRVVSAPTGSGKSTCAHAFIEAFIRTLSEPTKLFPSPSALYLVETIDQAESVFQTLKKRLGSKVAVWTSAHDSERAHQMTVNKRGWSPEYLISVDQLERYPVVIVTHQFYTGARGHKALLFAGRERSIKVVDERIREIAVYDVDTGLVKTVRDRLAEMHTADLEHVGYLTKLHEHLERLWDSAEGKRAYDVIPRSMDLAWFSAEEAYTYIASGDDDVRNVFGLGRSLANGFAFLSRYDSKGKGARFVGYEIGLARRPGTILLDATADVDGVSLIANDRVSVHVPSIDFSNLTIRHISSPYLKGRRVGEVIRSKALAQKYTDWIKKVIIEKTEDKECVLVVVHKGFLNDIFLPSGAIDWSSAFRIGERKVCFINWGFGIGSNRWKEASSVFLFGEFHVPKRTTIATLLGMKEKAASSTELAAVQSPNTQDRSFLALRDGHLCRWEKQLAMRGNARNIDPDGKCGVQQLVVTADFARFIRYKDQLFPGAQIVVEGGATRLAEGGQSALITLFSQSEAVELSYAEIKRETGIDLQKNKKRYLGSPLVQQVMSQSGWSYVPGRGRGNPSKFVKRPLQQRVYEPGA